MHLMIIYLLTLTFGNNYATTTSQYGYHQKHLQLLQQQQPLNSQNPIVRQQQASKRSLLNIMNFVQAAQQSQTATSTAAAAPSSSLLSFQPTTTQNSNILSQIHRNYFLPQLSKKFPQTLPQTLATPHTLLTSYGPPASGEDSVHIVRPPALQSLPPLQPDTVLKQLMQTYASTKQNENHQRKLQLEQQNIIQQINNMNAIVPLKSTESFLIPANNFTLYAANLLAASLLNDHNNPNESQNYIQIGPNTFMQNDNINLNYNHNSNNKTDLIILKTQKKSYVIPMTVIATNGNIGQQNYDKIKYQELYNNRDKLPIAYTVNQFLFFIKPQNVNFLNKLV